jgi:alpha-beta hydrolase superfamily lysophospholipase
VGNLYENSWVRTSENGPGLRPGEKLSRIFVTGHSLGGAMATLYASLWMMRFH